MKKSIHLFLLLISFTLILPSCVSKKKWTELVNQKAEIDQALEGTQTQVSNLEKNLKTLNEEKEQLALDYKEDKEGLMKKLDKVESEIGTLEKDKNEMMAAIEASNAKYAEVSKRIKDEFAKYTPSGNALKQEGQKMYVKGANEIKFKSGSARIKKESKELLKPIAEMLINNPGAFLLVEGHTDNVPMKAGARYASNEELSIARAKSVVKALVKLGVEKTQLSAKGHGDKKPMVAYDQGADMELARSTNRRADLAIMVSPAGLFQMGQTL